MNKYKTTLSEDIQQLSDPKYIISINNKESAQLVVDLVMKFFYNYIYSDSYNTQLNQNDIIETIKIYEKSIIEDELRKINLYESHKNKSERDMIRYVKSEYWYALDMIWSIYSTAEIIIDIINRKIDPQKFDKKFVWLDLGTWSWILLLAQYILAHKNKFENIENYGIEITPHVAQKSNEIAKTLKFWNIIQWSTLDYAVYQALYMQDKKINFISNETITSPWIPMNTIDTDPYIYNYFMLKKNLSKNIWEYTEHFPSRLWVIRKWYQKKYYLDNTTDFGISDQIKNFMYLDAFWATISPEDMYINGEYINLIDIWDRIKQVTNSWIKHQPYRRW